MVQDSTGDSVQVEDFLLGKKKSIKSLDDLIPMNESNGSPSIFSNKKISKQNKSKPRLDLDGKKSKRYSTGQPMIIQSSADGIPYAAYGILKCRILKRSDCRMKKKNEDIFAVSSGKNVAGGGVVLSTILKNDVSNDVEYDDFDEGWTNSQNRTGVVENKDPIMNYIMPSSVPVWEEVAVLVTYDRVMHLLSLKDIQSSGTGMNIYGKRVFGPKYVEEGLILSTNLLFARVGPVFIPQDGFRNAFEVRFPVKQNVIYNHPNEFIRGIDKKLTRVASVDQKNSGSNGSSLTSRLIGYSRSTSTTTLPSSTSSFLSSRPSNPTPSSFFSFTSSSPAGSAPVSANHLNGSTSSELDTSDPIVSIVFVSDDSLKVRDWMRIIVNPFADPSVDPPLDLSLMPTSARNDSGEEFYYGHEGGASSYINENLTNRTSISNSSSRQSVNALLSANKKATPLIGGYALSNIPLLDANSIIESDPSTTDKDETAANSPTNPSSYGFLSRMMGLGVKSESEHIENPTFRPSSYRLNPSDVTAHLDQDNTKTENPLDFSKPSLLADQDVQTKRKSNRLSDRIVLKPTNEGTAPMESFAPLQTIKSTTVYDSVFSKSLSLDHLNASNGNDSYDKGSQSEAQYHSNPSSSVIEL